MTIEQLWQEHQAAPFPKGFRARHIDGIDFVMLDADIAGCVSTFLSRRRSLDVWRTAVLGASYRNVTFVLQHVNDEEGRRHFSRLEALARLTLDALREGAKVHERNQPVA
jgi:hypothetical protein